jgi:hypothetical protein
LATANFTIFLSMVIFAIFPPLAPRCGGNV